MKNDTDFAAGESPQRDARSWAKLLAEYRQPSNLRSVVEFTITIVPLMALWVIMWVGLDRGYWLTLVLAIPAGGFLVRMFMIQHDCSHGSFFSQRRANDWTGRFLGVLTLTPYGFWQRTHALHHAGSGNLDHRGFGDVDTLTVSEYQARPFWGRLKYRLYRHPLVMFGVGPAFLFILQHRLPVGLMRRGWQPWASTMGTNAAIVAIASVLIWLIGFKTFFLIQLPILIIAATAGVWLFFVQHQFEHTVWESGSDWDRQEAALHGSSHYDLPGFLRWFTGNIGVHHVHHLCSKIPFYRLQHVLRDYPELRDMGRLTILESFHCVRLVLWDETQRRLISFKEARAAA